MNDEVEAKFAQMFAPEPIPQGVVELFDRTKFFLDRIDLPGMKQMDLVLIAAIGSSPQDQQALPIPKPEPEQPDLINTSEPEKLATLAEVRDASNAPSCVPTGPMDAPITDTKPNPAAALHYETMSATELKAHAKEFHKKDWPLRMGKKQMIKNLMQLDKGNTAR